MSMSGERCSTLFVVFASNHTVRLAGSIFVTVARASMRCCANAPPAKASAEAMASAMTCFFMRAPFGERERRGVGHPYCDATHGYLPRGAPPQCRSRRFLFHRTRARNTAEKLSAHHRPTARVRPAPLRSRDLLLRVQPDRLREPGGELAVLSHASRSVRRKVARGPGSPLRRTGPLTAPLAYLGKIIVDSWKAGSRQLGIELLVAGESPP